MKGGAENDRKISFFIFYLKTLSWGEKGLTQGHKIWTWGGTHQVGLNSAVSSLSVLGEQEEKWRRHLPKRCSPFPTVWEEGNADMNYEETEHLPSSSQMSVGTAKGRQTKD